MNVNLANADTSLSAVCYNKLSLLKVKNPPSADIMSMFPAKQYTGYDEL